MIAVIFVLLVAMGGLVYLWLFSESGGSDEVLHRARWAKPAELHPLSSHSPESDGLLVGTQMRSWFLSSPTWFSVTSNPKRRELGNLLIVGPTRSGKGLLATTQLLTWPHSVVVNDIKGELFEATAGYRATLGPVFVVDPEGLGHRYDPLKARVSEDELYSAAVQLLWEHDERDPIFSQRAAKMLAALFAAARKLNVAPLLFVGSLVRSGLQSAACQVNQIDPRLCVQFLGSPLEQTEFQNRFLLSAWETLSSKLWPLLTEKRLRTFAGSDVDPTELMLSEGPVTLYLRWSERDLLALAPLVRLLWDSLTGELIRLYDARSGAGCHPVMLLIDEAGRTAIPSLAEHATTVVGRGISLWIAIQSLSQLEMIYGKARSHVLRDNMESQLYYRPTDLGTAQYLETRLGKLSAYARSTVSRDGKEASESRSEQAIPLLTAQEIMQLADEEVVGFHRALPPFRLSRVDWRTVPLLKSRKDQPPPILEVLPEAYGSVGVAPTPLLSAGYIH